MVGSILYNILTSTIVSVYTFILAIRNNTPEHALFRSIIIFILTFLIVYLIRKALFFVTKTNRETLTVETYSETNYQDGQSYQNQEEIDHGQAAEQVRTLLQEEQRET
ncbi:hypothetical protein [Alkalibacillus salilacus]|uniref:Mannitol-specific phosphotransferase system IIBC component n=1 Tax=Alkalibacillus salilacus TaxID=284582 RepID=A0ABT9VDM2_9BACI|nr:hypothetical protein [Alkalibacillus salilacus]MDQ0159069.1 mannitol-specific phosphotransferase system IIBC component [Alkalibacillus salilacus]